MLDFSSRLLLDESSATIVDAPPSIPQQDVDSLLTFLEYADDSGVQVECWSQIWTVGSPNGRILSDWLFSDSGIDRDSRLLLGSYLGKLPKWDDSTEYSPFDAVIVGQSEVRDRPTIGYASYLRSRTGRGVACFTSVRSGLVGPVEVHVPSENRRVPVHFLTHPKDALDFWRHLADLEDLGSEDLESLAPLAFPALVFSARTWRHMNRLEGPIRSVRPLLMRDLAGLNDHAIDVWSDFVEPARKIAEMSSRAGVDCSPDSSKSHRNKSAMAERKVEFSAGLIDCEWHTKLEPNRNRVHFAVVENTVYVGLFTAHLTT